jgi:hypothetical protein
MAIGVLALVGTRKGLFLLWGDDDRRGWRVDGPLLDGWGVYHATVDARDGMFYAAVNHVVYGPAVQRSADGGKTWERSKKIGLPAWSGLTVSAVWHVEAGLPRQPGTLYLGADPGVLFRSDDAGETWEPNRGILEHPTRERWFPGAGGLCCDSIQLDPGDPQRMYVCIASAGTLRSEDGGHTWSPVNKNVAAGYFPDPYPEIGQCVHKLLLHPVRPERLWQQNHFGVYRSDNRGDSWERLDGNGLPASFGFPIMIDPKDPDTACVIPERSPEYHYSPDGRLPCTGRGTAAGRGRRCRTACPARPGRRCSVRPRPLTRTRCTSAPRAVPSSPWPAAIRGSRRRGTSRRSCRWR